MYVCLISVGKLHTIFYHIHVYIPPKVDNELMPDLTRHVYYMHDLICDVTTTSSSLVQRIYHRP